MKIKNKNILITGGAGFIGTNLVKHFQPNNHIYIVDNLSRKGTDNNIRFLQENYEIDFIQADIIEDSTIDTLLQQHSDMDIIIHLASQVAVTSSISDPKNDFYQNAISTLNMLEYARSLATKPIFLFASTNKVYGALEQIETVEKTLRYDFKNLDKGVDEKVNLDFHSPYGCSKGCADQYVRDYYRIYKIPTVVFRQSCIYGEHQYGVEDQGWLAWFIIAALSNWKTTVYGSGKQVRDVLHISDLAVAFEKAIDKIDQTKGEIFNIGGGVENSLSLLEFFEYLKRELKISVEFNYSDVRFGDQKIFMSDNSKIKKILNWKPEINYSDGIKRLYKWINNNMEVIQKTLQKL